MATPNKDETAETPKVKRARWDGARFVAGQWLAEDGSPLTDKEAQQAHRAMDRTAMEVRQRIMEGR